MLLLSGEADAGAAAPDGGWIRGGGLEPLCSDGLLGLGRGLAWSLGGDLEICVDSESVDPAGSSSGNAKVDLVATSGRRPRIWWRVFVAFVGCVVWATSLLACLVFRPIFLINRALYGFWTRFSL